MPVLEEVPSTSPEFEEISTMEAAKIWIKIHVSRIIWPLLGISAAVALVAGIVFWIKHKKNDED